MGKTLGRSSLSSGIVDCRLPKQCDDDDVDSLSVSKEVRYVPTLMTVVRFNDSVEVGTV
jgi:hypothetical protein